MLLKKNSGSSSGNRSGSDHLSAQSVLLNKKPSDKTSYRPKTREEIARNMSAIRSSENRVEGMLRKAIHARGLRYRKYAPDVLGKPDIVFPGAKVAVFVDGDYWHCRVLVEQGSEALQASLRTPTRDYWLRKFMSRVTRDQEITAGLRAQGWLVLRFWESDVKKDVQLIAGHVAAAVLSRRQRGKHHASDVTRDP